MIEAAAFVAALLGVNAIIYGFRAFGHLFYRSFGEMWRGNDPAGSDRASAIFGVVAMLFGVVALASLLFVLAGWLWQRK